MPLVADEGRALAVVAALGIVEQVSSRPRVPCQPKRTTSTGSRQRSPRRSTSLRDSATTTQRREPANTSFSRSSAPPPPLSTARVRITSSAPSSARSSSGASSGSATGSPAAATFRAVSGDAQTTSAGRALLVPSASAVAQTARPEPRPSRMPGSTSSSAARTATARAASALSA